VSKKTLYKHFPGKEDLVVSMIVQAMRRIEESIREADPSVPAIERRETIFGTAAEQRADSALRARRAPKGRDASRRMPGARR
jgi:AcrR family transcriptional regulator